MPSATVQPSAGDRRGAVNAVHSVDCFVFTVPDLAEAERFYRTFGLDARRETSPQGRHALSLRTFGNPHVWGRLHPAPGVKQLQYVSFGIFEEDEWILVALGGVLGGAIGTVQGLLVLAL